MDEAKIFSLFISTESARSFCRRSLRVATILIVVLTVGILATYQKAVDAFPVYDETECTDAFNVPSGWLDDQSTSINYYVHEDFADAYESCMGTTGFTQFYATGMVKQAAEIWNTQSRSTKLVYRGHTSHDPNYQFCDATGIAKPAIIVTFREGCRLQDSCSWEDCPPAGESTGCPCNNNDCTGSFGSIRRILDSNGNECDDAILVEIVGDAATAFGCPSSSRHPWNLDMADSSGRQFINILVHEFGHALGLGHPPSGLVSGGDANAIMPPGGDRRHLGTWDKDCVDDPENAGSSWVRPYFRTTDFNGDWDTTWDIHLPTFRGSSIYGHWTDGSDFFMPHYETLHEDYPSSHPEYDPSPDATVSLQEFSPNTTTIAWSGRNSLANMIGALDTTPVWYQRRSAGSGDGHRVNFTWDSSSSDPDTAELRYRRSDDLHQTSGWGRYRECLPDPHDCSGAVVMESAIPLVHAYDPYSDTDVLVSVSDTAAIDGGRIKVHAGFHPSGSLYMLNPGHELSVATTTHTGWHSSLFPDYSFLTDFLPGVACAPDREEFEYNCLLAWADRVVPNGRVHYTYFRIEPGADVEFHSDAWTRAGSLTTSHVTAGYFNDTFWMGWKRWTSPQGVDTTWNQGSYANWSTVDTLTRPKIVDPPSFAYDPLTSGTGRATWTESTCCDP